MHNSNTGNKPCLLVVEDDYSLREAIADTLELAGYDVLMADNGRAAIEVINDQSTPEIDMVISDVQMPKMDGHQLLKHIRRSFDIPVLLMTAYGTIDKAIEAMKDGAVDYLVKPFEAEVLVSVVSRFIRSTNEDNCMIAQSPQMQSLAIMAKKVAGTDATVMIAGASGTGKEVIARYIHQHSARANGPFVAINCAAIPENMLEATLFGYEKGAFTGAYKSSAGKFEQAQGGTLLLDEVSEMDLGLQAKLLRVLQEKEVERLGGHELISLDVRVLATSNRDMRTWVEDGKFREDLFYRLNVFPLYLPDLAARPDDIIPIAEYLLQKIARSNGAAIPELTHEARAKLMSYSWPGNIRELDNVMQRAFILHLDSRIGAEDIPLEQSPLYVRGNSQERSLPPIQTSVQSPVQPAEMFTPASASERGGAYLGEEMRYHEFDRILDTLTQTMGNRKKAAERLGISQRTLRYKMAKMRETGIDIPGGFGVKTA